ncbi:Integral membrane family protein [Pleurostoma richardsiae]|uniref:Integral membrane family protein n=1 Tax=Pleurostoma richardsiae TaxID=41990 RepID=A0AA38VJ93_9PEZI|nr:Integral membrane family protein [Pleurostoma richardsiae]
MADDADTLNEDNGAALVGTAVSFLVLTYISVALRTYVRGFLTKGFQADDWLMLLALASFTISCSFILVGVHVGIGHHNKALQQNKEIEALKWQALATANYILNTLFVKLSIGVFLLRLSVQKRYTYTLWVTMAIVTVWSIVLFFWDIFQCSPVDAQWDYTIPNSKCVSAQQIVNAAYALSVMTICSDWLFALLPIPMIWGVKMTTQTKVTVVVILGLGVFASVATLIRLKFLSDLTDTDDILFAGTDAMVWTLIEPGIAISAASLVVLRPLLRAWRLRGFESTENTGGRNTQRSGAAAAAAARGVRISGGMPGFGPGDLTLIDMETGRGDGMGARRGGGGTGGIGGINNGFPSQATTLTDRTLTASKASRASGSGDSTPVWGGAVGAGGDRSSSYLDARGGGGGGDGSSKSEVFVIEGPVGSMPRQHHDQHGRWRGRDDSPSVASEEIDALEAQSQYSGKVGLGGRR